jgi:hypothetical protein
MLCVDGLRNEVMQFFNVLNPYSRAVALRLTLPLTEMSTTNLPGDKARPTRKADNLTAIYLPTVYKMCFPQFLLLQASRTCYWNSYTSTLLICTSIYRPIYIIDDFAELCPIIDVCGKVGLGGVI